MVERIGGGDAFTAGLIYALQTGMPQDDAVQFSAAACAFKHSVLGDMGYMTEGEVRALAFGEGVPRGRLCVRCRSPERPVARRGLMSALGTGIKAESGKPAKQWQGRLGGLFLFF